VREIVVLSGKGGTGKTSFVAAFAELAGKGVALGDCDVDASNLALLMPGEDVDEEPFFAGLRARIDENRCSLCSSCVDVCRYDALTMEDGQVPRVNDLNCEGCRACSVVCPEEAFTYVENRSGTLFMRETKVGPLIHASLGIAQDNSGKLVTRVRERVRTLAEERGIDTILIDGPPGIGCPVHASLTGIGLVVAVTEPTPSGAHDLERLLDLCTHFKLKAVVIVNKFDLNGKSTFKFERISEERGAELIGGVPFNKEVPMALARGAGPLTVPVVREALERIWARIELL
jgi:MinD superfamily P-loop ATPase